ncbi:MAG TPA: GNAT family N-acetyltransferase [Candidatus Acidoferrum sp.]|nr:GNAT family N-acetyltransferase [Candidatus Acidoferrum sp.]
MKRLASPPAVRLLTQYHECASLQTAWNEIVRSQSGDILQLDVTCTFEWVMTLWRNHLEGKEEHVLVLGEDPEIVAILPFHKFRKQVHGLPCRALAPLTELYSGRSGFLIRDPNGGQFEAVLGALCHLEKDWDVFQFTLVDGSAQHEQFFAWQRDSDLVCEEVCRQASPYIVLQENWSQHFTSLPKKFRSTIRNGEKRMRACGHLEYREFRGNADFGCFAAAMMEIERDSWKEAAGTSLTSNRVQETFHTEFLKSALHTGWLSGHLLLLNNEPIAYVHGLLHNGIFSDLKESYKTRFREMSPGHVLKAFVFESLYAAKTRLYDFMGLCEDYKMKWTDRTYSRTTYLLYNRTARAWAARRMSSFKAISQVLSGEG